MRRRQRRVRGNGRTGWIHVRTDRPRRRRVRARRRMARRAARRTRLPPRIGRHDRLGSAAMTAAPALSPIRNRPREVTTVAFYVSVTLAAELAVASSDDSKAILVGALWGTAVGLALAHWYAQTITAAIARGAFETNDAVEGLRELGAAVVVAFILSLPFVVFQTPT